MKKLKEFPLKPVSRIGHPLCPIFFSVELGTISRAVRQEKEIQWIPYKRNMSNSMTTFLRDLYDPTRKLLYVINTFNKVAGYKTDLQK